MKRKKNKSIILKLIRDGLINLKLINGLIASGLDAHDYRISIGDAIFVLMGFKNNKIHDFILLLYAWIMDLRCDQQNNFLLSL